MAATATKLSIIIPVFNEAAFVRELLSKVVGQKIPSPLRKELIIVESNSTDGSREIVQKFLKDNEELLKQNSIEARLILQPSPRGKGNATREGLLLATGDIILIQDADLEYDVNDYPYLVQPILNGHADFVLGSRHLSAGSWKIRKFVESPMKAAYMNFGGTLFHTMFNLVYGTKLTDPTTMFKVFRRDCIRGVVFQSNRFDFDYELVAKLIRLGFQPLEVPVSYTSRGFEAGKKISIFRDPFTWVAAIIKFRFTRIRRISADEQKQLSQKIATQVWAQA